MLSKGELEELRPWVSFRVAAVLGGHNLTVVNSVLDCIGKSLNRQATTEKLRTYMEHETGKFVDALYKKVLEIKSANLSGGGVLTLPTGKRGLDDANSDAALKRPKKSRFDDGAEGAGLSGSITGTDIQAMMASTIKQIEERRKHTSALLNPAMAAYGLPASSTLGFPQPAPALSQTSVLSDAIEKARRAAELQARIQNQLVGKPDLLSAMKNKAQPSKPVPVVMDAEGKVDMPMVVRQPTLKANIRAAQRAQFRQITKEQQHRGKEEDKQDNHYFDHRVAPVASVRGRRVFKFTEPGKFIKQGQTMRAKAQLEKLQSEIASTARKTGISSATKLALIAPGTEEREDDIPMVEWWDADVLPNRTYADFDRSVSRDQKYREISCLVEHPVMVDPSGVPSAPVQIPVMLTKSERKKIRKQTRREAENEKQEKIRLGLIDKPEPKVKISNLMRVLGNEAIQDPTKMEAHVRAQMAERQRKHDETNAARKLTPEQRRAKKFKKLTEDVSCGVHVTVYRVRDLSNQSNKFKVDMNAQQYHLTGCVLVHRDINVVVVEGGPKALKKYKRLMLHRIKWKRGTHADDDDSDNEQPTSKKQNSCTIVWEGVREERSFSDWRFKQCPSESVAREHLKKYGTEHYWDMALSETIVEQEEQD